MTWQVGQNENPVNWWLDFGDNNKPLQDLALRVVGISPTAAGLERANSTMAFVWKDSRSRMLVGRMAMLVYIYYNHRALKRMKERTSLDVLENTQYLLELEIGDAQKGMDCSVSCCLSV